MGSLTVNCFGGVEDGSVIDLYYGDETGFVRQSDVGNDDDGAAIASYATYAFSGYSRSDDGTFTGYEHRKQFQYSETFIQPDGTLSMTPYYALDLMDDTQARTSGNYTALTAETVSGWSGTGTKRKRIRFYGLNGKTLLLKWYHATVAQNFIMHPSVLHFDWKTRIEIA
jgi:hypothetical protein